MRSPNNERSSPSSRFRAGSSTTRGGRLLGRRRSVHNPYGAIFSGSAAGLVRLLARRDPVPLSQIDPSKIVTGARHSRNNKGWPAVGIFAQRGKNRPNRIGSTICRIVRVEGIRLFVAEFDAIDGTPVLDIKPVMAEFLPRQEVRQPAWSHDLMRNYWLRKG